MFSGSLVALVTPIDKEGNVDYLSLGQLIDFHLQAGTDGLVLLGSTGEGWAFSEAEKLEIVDYSLKRVNGKMPVIAGIGENSTKKAVLAAREMMALKVDGLLIICPFYNKPTQEGVYQHFLTIASSVNTPIILYNHPGRTGTDLLPDTVARLAKIDNIVGLKEAVTDEARMDALAPIKSEQFCLLSGDDESFLRFMKKGASGVISVTANIVPKAIQQLASFALQDDWEASAAINSKYIDLYRFVNVESNPIPVKSVLSKIGLIKNCLQLPLMPLSEQYESQVTEILANYNLTVNGDDNHDAI